MSVPMTGHLGRVVCCVDGVVDEGREHGEGSKVCAGGVGSLGIARPGPAQQAALQKGCGGLNRAQQQVAHETRPACVHRTPLTTSRFRGRTPAYTVHADATHTRWVRLRTHLLREGLHTPQPCASHGSEPWVRAGRRRADPDRPTESARTAVTHPKTPTDP